MGTKRDDIIEFAIGTKIKYNGKLYEVVEQKYCDECSIATICANSDKTDANPTKVLSKNKRLSVFGECSGIIRSDSKSVIFKEVSSNEKVSSNEEDVYDVEILYKNDKELLPIRINIPSNYTIDEENSDLTKGIIRFKSNWLSIEQIYKALNDRGEVTYRESLKDLTSTKMLAIANLIDISLYFNKDWNYNVTDKDSKGYAIYYNSIQLDTEYCCNLVNLQTSVYYGTPIFKNREDAQYVIDNPNFKTVLDKIFKV